MGADSAPVGAERACLLKSWALGRRLTDFLLHLGDHCPGESQICAVLRVSFAINSKKPTYLMSTHLESVNLTTGSFSEWIRYDEFAQSHFT